MSADKDARIAELTAKLDAAIDALAERDDKEARLERKLAGQQAALFTIRTIVAGCDSDEATRIIRHLQKHFDNQHAELDNLLAKAKEEGRKNAVPDVGNIREVNLTGDFVVKLVFNSCRAASSFVEFIRSRT